LDDGCCFAPASVFIICMLNVEVSYARQKYSSSFAVCKQAFKNVAVVCVEETLSFSIFVDQAVFFLALMDVLVTCCAIIIDTRFLQYNVRLYVLNETELL
jgi:hypothetical protein